MIGMTNRKIIVVPCIVKSWSYASGDSCLPSAVSSWMRMASAIRPPTRKKNSVRTRYMIPIRLWSTVESHERRPPESGAATPVMGTGWLWVAIRPSPSSG